MREELEEGRIRLYPSDWRYSASIVGLVRYFRYRKIEYLQTDDYIEYAKDVINEEDYLLFAEEFFSEKMHHIGVLQLLEQGELTQEQEKEFQKKINGNTICKKIFKDIKYDGTNEQQIRNLIDENRQELIKETYRSAKTMYQKYANTGKLLMQSGEVCRLNGYYVDAGRKNKALSYFWDKNTFVGQDEIEFDFIPFGFSKTSEAFFINNNFTIDLLLKTNNRLLLKVEDQEDSKGKGSYQRKYTFLQKQNVADFISYDVEVITKKQEIDFFETLYIRKSAVKIFESIKPLEYETLLFYLKINDKQWLNIEEIVVKHIINHIHLDEVIEVAIKKAESRSYNIQTLIKINAKIYGGEEMNEQIEKARNTAFAVKKNMDSNKIKSYRQKLINTLTFKDYDKFCQILLQLSDYSGVIFSFAYDLFDDFERNKNIAYAFVNGLNENNYQGGEK